MVWKILQVTQVLKTSQKELRRHFEKRSNWLLRNVCKTMKWVTTDKFQSLPAMVFSVTMQLCLVKSNVNSVSTHLDWVSNIGHGDRFYRDIYNMENYYQTNGMRIYWLISGLLTQKHHRKASGKTCQTHKCKYIIILHVYYSYITVLFYLWIKGNAKFIGVCRS